MPFRRSIFADEVLYLESINNIQRNGITQGSIHLMSQLYINMSERAKTVGNIKVNPRTELVVSQTNTASINAKRSKISKKADSVSSLSGIYRS